MGIGIKPVSEFGSKRLIRMAIEVRHEAQAAQSVTLVHKGNIMKFTEGAFKDWGYELAREEFGDHTCGEVGAPKPEGKILIKRSHRRRHVPAGADLRPDEYSVIATTNLNGDYLSDALAAQVGGLGIAPAATSVTPAPCSRQPTAPRPSTPARTK